ncbi:MULTISPECIES: hypothetical protein [unclassified Streptomyces]|uniref:hypothetical protein n=1 Tax=unclassified Streptomyces TaxID=2593676 RepID=UPI002E2412CE
MAARGYKYRYGAGADPVAGGRRGGHRRPRDTEQLKAQITGLEQQVVWVANLVVSAGASGLPERSVGAGEAFAGVKLRGTIQRAHPLRGVRSSASSKARRSMAAAT